MKLSNHNEVVIEKFATMIISRMESMKASDWKQGWMNRLPSTSKVTATKAATPSSSLSTRYCRNGNILSTVP